MLIRPGTVQSIGRSVDSDPWFRMVVEVWLTPLYHRRLVGTCQGFPKTGQTLLLSGIFSQYLPISFNISQFLPFPTKSFPRVKVYDMIPVGKPLPPLNIP